MTVVSIPRLSLVVLMGPTAAGKSTFARAHFLPSEVLGSDACRAMVSDDENDQSASADAFEILYAIAAKRLARGRLTVIDATHLRPEDRRPLIAMARRFHVLPVVIAFHLPESTCQERNAARSDRRLPSRVVRDQCIHMRSSLRHLKREGFRHVTILTEHVAVDTVQVERTRMWSDRREESGPFDIIGDVHGCFDELRALIDDLGYRLVEGENGFEGEHPEGRTLVFVGDLVDRGPASDEVLRLVIDLCALGVAQCVPGNHENKLRRALLGANVQRRFGLAETMEQLARKDDAFRTRVVDFIHGLISHHVYDEGRLVVAHAGIKEDMQGRGSREVREFCLYGETTGETDEFGLPVRYDWASGYRGAARVVYGHTPVPTAEWHNRTICIDTGCVFGGRLTALRYPELELVSVAAARVYCEPVRPLETQGSGATARTAQQVDDGLLALSDVIGKRFFRTRHGTKVTIREHDAAAALEVISRFAIDPRWLIYLPPTMAPASPTLLDGYLEHPTSVFADLQRAGVDTMVAEEKHMGSRAILIVCRDEDAALRRFGVVDDGIGVCYTRTGRPFFPEERLQQELLQRVRSAIDAAGLWEEFGSDWFCLDAELMPWSAKGRELVRQQYAAVGAAGELGLSRSIAALERARDRGLEVGVLHARFAERREHIAAFRRAYRPYCWEVDGLSGWKLAPFHLLASEGAVHDDKDHPWHLRTLARLATADPELIVATAWQQARLDDAAGREQIVEWWTGLTAAGGEGLVFKPLGFLPDALSRGGGGRARSGQPALKCRGAEYLRLIYGAEYRTPERLQKLRGRGLSRKRLLAWREFCVGLEGLHRFVEGEALRRVHECVFSVLALESEPVDPRL